MFQFEAKKKTNNKTTNPKPAFDSTFPILKSKMVLRELSSQ